MLSYKIKAESLKGGIATSEANNSYIPFDASAGRKENLPNPAELLLSALAACMLKNVERFSKILKFDYEKATVEINGVRTDTPPSMEKISYTLKIQSTMDEKKSNLLHKNILKFGTITNTLAKSSELKGSIELL